MTWIDLIYRTRRKVLLWKAKYRSWKYRRAVRRAERALQERKRMENLADEYDEFPMFVTIYEGLRMAYMQTFRRWFP